MENKNCIFCQIISGKAKATVLFQNEELIVFKDIKPSAKHHYLVVPKKHIQNINSLVSEDDKLLVERMVQIGKKVLEENEGNLNDLRMGFHVPPFNSVGHLHLHVISPVSEMSTLSSVTFRANSWWFQNVEEFLKKLDSKL